MNFVFLFLDCLLRSPLYAQTPFSFFIILVLIFTFSFTYFSCIFLISTSNFSIIY
ncbi:unnamed protein product [Meloidogyne enterolobii]|uniref:Uncharacterized protein n=1 Tax=Meloidogyne enterolobii TaxID=390850 RepID=A0ACB0ZAG8_MELEN